MPQPQGENFSRISAPNATFDSCAAVPTQQRPDYDANMLTRRARLRVASVFLACSCGATAASASARVDGRLASYPLVYKYESDNYDYVVFFRTRGVFVGHDSVGTTIPGTLALEDALDNHDGFGTLDPSRHCHAWNFRATKRLRAVKVGQKVHLHFKLRATPKEQRTVTVRRAPRRVRDSAGRLWFERGRVAQHLTWIGCPPTPSR
jgi:hypothetical protein